MMAFPSESDKRRTAVARIGQGELFRSHRSGETRIGLAAARPDESRRKRSTGSRAVRGTRRRWARGSRRGPGVLALPGPGW
jgi:hypothetical protein